MMRFNVPACQIFFTLFFHALCYVIPTNSQEPTEKDIKCFNDYESKVKCQLSSDSCSEYKLNVTHDIGQGSNEYSCIFKQSRGSATDCECKFNVSGFVLTEIFTTTLLKGGNDLFTKKWQTMDFIQPKTPVITVQKTENGHFKVTWDSNYKTYYNNFVDGLKIKLYGINGKRQKEPLEELNRVGFIEIISSNLDPKTKYSLTATMSTHYNNYMIESDRSEPYEFTTPPSPNEKLKMIPVVCVALITVIFIIFIVIFRIKTVWWDKISKPKINLDFVKNSKTLPPYIAPISSIRADILKSDLENKWILPSVDTNSEKSSNSVDSVAIDYAQTCSGTREEDNVARLVRHLEVEFKRHKSTNPLVISSSYNPVPVVSENSLGTSSQRHRDSGNCSGSSFFSNQSYLKSPTDSSSFLETPTCDLSYINEPKINSDNYPVGSDTGKTQFDDNPDEMLTKNKLIMSKNPLYPTLVCDNEYQDVRSLTNSTKEQLNSRTSITEAALDKCGAMSKVFETGGHAPCFQPPTLHIIEMVDSYHPV